mmetsp:Transcript_585/g.821  ORF Transcript_585/g.821 Transcript_585/m.821 type:complete len:112 (+) Transcript_585:243-578(+)
MQGLSKEQQKVYQQIELSGDKGIWVRDIKLATGIQQQTITKALKILESRRLIKSVQGVHSKTKKLYMLYDVGEPNRRDRWVMWAEFARQCPRRKSPAEFGTPATSSTTGSS